MDVNMTPVWLFLLHIGTSLVYGGTEDTWDGLNSEFNSIIYVQLKIVLFPSAAFWKIEFQTVQPTSPPPLSYN